MPRLSRLLAPVGLGALLLAVVPATGAAQYIFIGGGPTFPNGDYGDYANTGFMLDGGVGFNLSPNLSVGGELFWGQNNHEDYEVILARGPSLAMARNEFGEKTTLYGLNGFVQYEFSPAAKLNPYLFGTIGYLTHSFSADYLDDSESESGVSFGGGGGLGYAMGPSWGLFGEGRFTTASIEDSNTSFLGLFFGAFFSLGGGGGQ